MGSVWTESKPHDIISDINTAAEKMKNSKRNPYFPFGSYDQNKDVVYMTQGEYKLAKEMGIIK